jgi:hypothetical protein
MFFFKKLFPGKPDARIAKWTEIFSLNNRDRSVIGRWVADPTLEDEINAKLQSFAREPDNIELGEEIVKLGTKFETEKPIRFRLAAAGGPTIEHRTLERTRPAAKAVLQAVLEGLRAELSSVESSDQKQAEKYGIGAKPSPVATELQSAAERVQGIHDQIDQVRDTTNVVNLVNQVLEK